MLSRIWGAKSATTLDQKVGHTVDAGVVEVEVFDVVVVDDVVVDVVVIEEDDELDDVGWAEEVLDVVVEVLDDVATLEVVEVDTLEMDEETDVVLVDVSVDRVAELIEVDEDVVGELEAEHAKTAGSEPE